MLISTSKGTTIRDDKILVYTYGHHWQSNLEFRDIFGHSHGDILERRHGKKGIERIGVVKELFLFSFEMQPAVA